MTDPNLTANAKALAMANLAAITETLPRVQTPVIADFLRCMQRIHPADRLPARAAFDPMTVPHLLRHLVLVQVERPGADSLRYLVRVAGELVLAAAPVPLMNRHLEGSVGITPGTEQQSKATILDVRRQVVESGKLVYWRGKSTIPFRFDFGDLEYVHCPLAEDGVTVDRVLSCFFYHGAAPA